MKKYNWAITTSSLIGFVLAIFLLCQPDAENICQGSYYGFFPYAKNIFSALFIISIILYFVREEVFRAWGKFALWFIPLSAILVSKAPDYSHDWILPLDKKLVGSSLGVLFFLLSLLIIAIKSWRLRKIKRS